MNNNTLNHLSILFFTFFMLAVIFSQFTKKGYDKSNEQVVNIFKQNDYLINYFELHQILKTDNSNYQFVDLRNRHRFLEGHLPNAINIPLDELLLKHHIRALNRESKKKLVFYSDREADAHTAKMLLVSVGFDGEIKVVPGTFNKFVEVMIKDFDVAYSFYKDEKAKFDYLRFFESTTTESEKEKMPAGIIPQVKTETISVQGGC